MSDEPWHASQGEQLTLADAAILQGFPRDHPWQGSRTKQFQQIGNAIPPPLAEAGLRAIVTATDELRRSE